MDWKEILGYVSGAFTTLSFVPQAWQLYRLRSAREISLPFNLLFMCGVAFWLAYGILLHLTPVILWNAVPYSTPS
ncbi:MAG: PQ-loop domain-containing transporter [Chloroflexi bacterium]|nr:PQ-loop domain-containing transporter [Chloroflexota bacterium]